MNTITFLSQEQIKCTRNIDIMFGRGWWDLAQTHFMIFPRNLRLSQNTETSLTENYKIKYISGYGTKSSRPVVYCNGEYRPDDEAKVSVFDRGFCLEMEFMR